MEHDNQRTSAPSTRPSAWPWRSGAAPNARGGGGAGPRREGGC